MRNIFGRTGLSGSQLPQLGVVPLAFVGIQQDGLRLFEQFGYQLRRLGVLNRFRLHPSIRGILEGLADRLRIVAVQFEPDDLIVIKLLIADGPSKVTFDGSENFFHVRSSSQGVRGGFLVGSPGYLTSPETLEQTHPDHQHQR